MHNCDDECPRCSEEAAAHFDRLVDSEAEAKRLNAKYREFLIKLTRSIDALLWPEELDPPEEDIKF